MQTGPARVCVQIENAEAGETTCENRPVDYRVAQAQESLKQVGRRPSITVKHKSENWICNACGKTTDSDRWTLKTHTAERFDMTVTNEDYVILVCPDCYGSTVYKFSH